MAIGSNTPVPHSGVSRAPVVMLLWALLAIALATHGEEALVEDLTPAPGFRSDHDWYFFVAAVNVYPKLESEDLIHNALEPVLRGLSPGHPGVYTVSDLRDDHGLWPPHFGVGVNLSPKWSAFVEAGYTEGKLRTLLDRRSIVGLPLHTDFELKRGALFGGLGLDYFPWGMPGRTEYEGLRERLLATRPFLGTRLTWTHATYDVKVKLGLRPLPNFVNLELSDAWLLPSATIVGGVEVPLSRDTTLSFSAGYNYFPKRDFDFEGAAFTIQWKSYFAGPETRRARREESGLFPEPAE